MANQSTIEVLLSDPLGKTARQERNRLLLSSLVGLAVAKAHIIPTKISSLGVDFTGANQRAFVLLLALAVLYFLVAFAIYGLMDVLLALAIARKAFGVLNQRANELENWRAFSALLFYLRAGAFDFLFPCFLGIVTIVLLFRTHQATPFRLKREGDL